MKDLEDQIIKEFREKHIVPNGWIDTEKGRQYYDEKMAEIVQKRAIEFLSSALERVRKDEREKLKDRTLFALNEDLKDSWKNLNGYNQIFEKENKQRFVQDLNNLTAYIDGMFDFLPKEERK